MLEGDEPPTHFDLIKCGDCQADFALADICKFIDHKRKCYGTTCRDVSSSEDPPTLQLITKEDGKVQTQTQDDMDDKVTGATTDTTTLDDNATTTGSDEDGGEDEMDTKTATADIVRTEKPKITTPIKPRRISTPSQQQHQRDTSSPRVKQTQTDTQTGESFA